MRIGRQCPVRVGEVDAAEHVDDQAAPLGWRQPAMERQPLVELIAEPHRRIEGRHRLLEHHADARAAQGAPLPLGHSRGLFAIEPDGTGRAADGGWAEPDHGPGHHCLAGARFAHDAHDLAGRHGKACAVDDHALRLRMLQREAAHDQQRFGGGAHVPFIRGSRRSRSVSPKRLMPSNASAMHRPGKMPSQAAWPR